MVSDDRPEFCTKEANPDADQFIVTARSRIYLLRCGFTPNTYVVLTTRGVPIDVPGLAGTACDQRGLYWRDWFEETLADDPQSAVS